MVPQVHAYASPHQPQVQNSQLDESIPLDLLDHYQNHYVWVVVVVVVPHFDDVHDHYAHDEKQVLTPWVDCISLGDDRGGRRDGRDAVGNEDEFHREVLALARSHYRGVVGGDDGSGTLLEEVVEGDHRDDARPRGDDCDGLSRKPWLLFLFCGLFR